MCRAHVYRGVALLATMAVLLLLLLSPVLAASPASEPGDGEPQLSVPFLPQTEALCGGAAVAMLFRYWGERHADVQQFAPLVDRARGGIADTVLSAAIRDRGWNAERIEGSIASLRARLVLGQPVILLIEDRPRRYHYVVVVAISGTSVTLHDPAWGPGRTFNHAELLRRWQPSQYWALVVTPSAQHRPSTASHSEPAATVRPREAMSRCERLLDEALDRIDANSADATGILQSVQQQCPAEAAPIRELAGVRFNERRWSEAAALAEGALALDQADRYAWDVLGSSRFMLNDFTGALDAWNRAGKPIVDSVTIDGLKRTRYNLMARLIAITPNTLLTARQFAIAERRIQQLPDRTSARLALRPDVDDYAIVSATIVERQRAPHGALEWGAAAAQTFVDRELAAIVPGGSGQGEVWRASWRWWEHRPQVAFGFSAPRAGFLPGVWHVDFVRETQTYAGLGLVRRREERSHGGFSISNWITPTVRYQWGAGIDVWDDTSRTVMLDAALEKRMLGDRASVAVHGSRATGLGGAAGFSSVSIHGTAQSSTAPRGLVGIASADLSFATRHAPLALWPGAGDGRARTGLLRGHRLLRDGIVDGAIFGRRVMTVNVEALRWIGGATLLPIGVAGFVDIAAAGHRPLSARGKPFQVDVGAGMRLRLPGREGTLRVDYGRSLRDGGQAVTVGWTLRGS